MSEFAQRVGSTQGQISKYCKRDGEWPGRVVAEAIKAETQGKIHAGNFCELVDEETGEAAAFSGSASSEVQHVS